MGIYVYSRGNISIHNINSSKCTWENFHKINSRELKTELLLGVPANLGVNVKTFKVFMWDAGLEMRSGRVELLRPAGRGGRNPPQNKQGLHGKTKISKNS